MNNYTLQDIRRAAEYLTGVNFWQTRSLKFSDGPAGLRLQKGSGDSMGLKKSVPATAFPTHTALACGWDNSLAYGVGRRIGEEAAQSGVNILLAPAVNIKRNPYNGRNFEYFSEDPYLTGELASEYVRGVQSTGVGACVKHFAANNKETGRNVSDSVVSERTLAEIYLPAFEQVVKTSSPAAVMAAYNKLNGVYCSEDLWLLKDILRGKWGFKGIVVSDWGGTNDRVASVKAGMDVEMPACRFSADLIVEAYQKGDISAEEIFGCVERIKMAEERTVPGPVQFSAEEHHAYARKVAAECAVLIKNDGVLPLKSGSRIAVFGAGAKRAPMQGGGSSHVNSNSKRQSLLKELARDYKITGYKKYLGGGKSARRIIDKSDVILVVVTACGGDNEGDDKKTLQIPKKQQKTINSLVNRGKKVVCVLLSGGAADLSWDGGVNALLYFGISGQAFAPAAADVLSGRVNPSGKLAETFFSDPVNLPSTGEFFKDPYYTLYKEGMSVGYRYCSSSGAVPKYPFGHGLSYTRFEFSDISVDKDGAQITVKNSGGKDGAEVVQVYADFPAAAHCPRKLISFKKVFLKSGQSARVSLDFGPFAFRSYNTSTHSWVTVGGVYNVRIAQNALDGGFCTPVTIEGVSGVPQDCLKDLAPSKYPLTRNKKGRIVADLFTPFGELKNSKSALIRLIVKSALYFTRKNATLGGTMRYATVRMCAQFGGFSTRRKDALIHIFNGEYFRGIVKFITRGKLSQKLPD